MAISKLSRLAHNVPIVDPLTGHPTPVFQRILEQLLKDASGLEEQVDLTAGIDIIAGDVLDGGGPLDGSTDITLDHGTSGVTPGTYGDASNIPQIDVDEFGHITDISEVAFSSGGAAWALAGSGQTATGVYNQAVDGSKANIDFTGLGSYNELLIFARGLTAANSGVRVVQVSVNNGSSFYSASGDYVFINNVGVETNTTTIATHSTASTAARSITSHIKNLKGTPKVGTMFSGTAYPHIPEVLFVASTSDIDAIRVTNSAGGNITGGTVRVYAR